MALIKGKAKQPGKVKHPKSCADLAAALESADVSVRRDAARELLHCPEAAKALVGHLQREENQSVREVILACLVRLSDSVAVEGLTSCLRSEDPALRNEVIDTLKELTVDLTAVLQSLLSDSDPDIRIFAVNILESRRHPDVERWLIGVIEQDAHINVCATALDLLCEVGTEAALEPLLRLKARFASEAYIQFAADLAIKRIRAT